MSQNLFSRPFITYLVTISLFGLFLAGIIAFYPPVVGESFLWRKPIIGSIFGSICILGILTAFFPKQCSGVFDFRKEEKGSRSYLNQFASHGTSSTVKGHHPDCEGFSAHVFRVGNRTFCTACTGLLLGGLSALAGTILYFFSNWRVEQGSSLLVWVGILGVGFVLFQFRFRSFVRLFLNIFFVLGTFFILIGVDKLVHSVAVDLFLVALTLFWLFTRISLSQWDHERICYACKVATCEFADRKKEGRLVSTAKPVKEAGNHQYPKGDYYECPPVSNLYFGEPRDPCNDDYYAND